MAQDPKTAKRILKRQAETLWRLVTTTEGVADLAEPMKRAEFHFERLTQRQRVTVAVIASQLAKAFHDIETEETRIQTTETAPAVQADEIIPAGQDDIGDGSGTGD